MRGQSQENAMKNDNRIPVAIIGSGNIGTDLMIKVIRTAKHLSMGAMVGIDPASDGLARAKRLGVTATHEGVEGLVKLPNFKDIRIAFDATSAGAHAHPHTGLRGHGVQVIDLTPAAIGPYVSPVVNLDAHLGSTNINMVSCGGQATIPMVRAVSRVAKVHYGEIVASIASKSAGPGTRANIDKFPETTAKAIVTVGGAARGKALIILNPAEPPLGLRVEKKSRGRRVPAQKPINVPGLGKLHGLKVWIFLEVEGAAHYLPSYAGNLDIMTSAALGTAEQLAGP